MGKWSNSKKGFILLFFGSIGLLLLQYSCKPIVKTLGPFSSSNIEESKKVGVFLWEYYPVEVLSDDSSIHFKVNEAFAEKQYGYNSYNDLRFNISKDYTQIVLIVSDISKLGYFDLWTLDDFDWGGEYFGFVRDYDNVNPPDSLIVNILKVDTNKEGGSSLEDGKVIGSFVLRRKEQESAP